jgi:regulatory protein
MPVITQISEQKRRPNRRNLFLDGTFAFGCNVTVVARFRLREGMTLTPDQVQQIQLGEVRQECFDSAMRSLQKRQHSQAELRRKLTKKEYGETVINAVIADLIRLGYVDDVRFATAKALSAAKHKHHGQRRAKIELMKAGVKGEAADRALADVYREHDSRSVVTGLIEKQLPRLRKLEPMVARRRLMGMLQRRGFDYETIKPAIDEVLGRDRIEQDR